MNVLRFLNHRIALKTCIPWINVRFMTLGAVGKEPEEIRIPVPWGHIAGKWWGRKDVQPLILLHGWEDHSGSFDTLAPLLEVEGIFAFDFPGHGLSSHFPIGKYFHFMDAVITLRSIISHFKWSKVSLLGHSFGSATSYVYAAAYPTEVEKYISIECARTLMPERPMADIRSYSFIDQIMSVEQKMQKNKPPSYSYEEILKRLYEGSDRSVTIEACKILLHRGMVTVAGEKENHYYFSRDPRLRLHAWGRLSYDSVPELAPHITCAVLSIRGNQGSIIGGQKESVYFKTVEIMKKTAKRFEHHNVDGTHHLHINNPEIVAPLINNFLNS